MIFVQGAARVGLLKFSVYFGEYYPEIYQRYAGKLLPYSDASEAAVLEAAFRSEIGQTVAEGYVPRYLRVVNLLRLDRLGNNVLDFSLALLVYPFLAEPLKELSGVAGISMEMASLIQARLSGFQEDNEEQWQAQYAALSLLFCCDNDTGLFFRRPFVMDSWLYDFLSERDRMDEGFQAAATLSKGADFPMFIRKELALELAQGIKDDICARRPTLVSISGAASSGKRSLCLNALSELGYDCLVLDFDRLKKGGHLSKLALLAQRYCVLCECALCLWHVDKERLSKCSIPLSELYYSVLLPCVERGLICCVCIEPRLSLVEIADFCVRTVSLPPVSDSERRLLWEAYFAQRGVSSELNPAQLTSKYILSPREISRAAMYMQQRGAADQPLCERTVSHLITEILPPPQDGNIKKIQTDFTFSDIVLPARQKQDLLNICAHVQLKYKVYTEWNFGSKLSYGKNITALFVGSPGTGKTMAVHTIANYLDLPLYRIDLSQVVDKYIGETEKRLEEIFSTAEKSNVILFFDEADSIFGKRSEVKESKDRYANTEVSYILQRIEEYEGIIILASNFRNNIDNAFMRRMRYVIEFPPPDEEMRLELWQCCFPKETPLQRIDYAFLARAFELTGAEIKNIAVNAAFTAAAEDAPVSMSHIVNSIRGERLKMKQNFTAQDFEQYAPLLIP